MSNARSVLFPRQPSSQLVWDWEADNFAWIDFFWSTLGRSGHAGQDVGLIYDMLQSEGAMRRLASELGRFLGNRGPKLLRPLTRRFGAVAAADLVGEVARRERGHVDHLLSPAADRGLTEYLAGPLALQYGHECEGAARGHLSFVFGHTHKPFEQLRPVPGSPTPWSVYNTGGWVVDTAQSRPLHGAAVVLIDNDCNVASLRMYNQSVGPLNVPVRIVSAEGTGGNPLQAFLAETVNCESPPWTTLSAVVAEEVARRQRLLPQIIQRGLQYTR